MHPTIRGEKRIKKLRINTHTGDIESQIKTIPMSSSSSSELITNANEALKFILESDDAKEDVTFVMMN